MNVKNIDVAFQGSVGYGGVSRFTIELSKALANKVNSVTVFPTSNSVDNPTSKRWWDEIPENLNIKNKHTIAGNLFRDSFSFRKYDVIHVNYGTFGLSGVVAKTLFNVPYIYTIHCSLEMELKQKNWFSWVSEEIIERQIALPITARFGENVTVSEHSKQVLENYLDKKIDFIYHGINDQDIKESNIRSQLGIAQDSNICLTVGRFYPTKKVDEVIKSAAYIEDEFEEDINFILVGGGSGFDRITTLVKEYELDNVTILEDISDEDLNQLYTEADLFVLPSTTETFGIVYLEAMSTGTPVICANAGAAPEVVGDAGKIVEPSNPLQLAKTIQHLISDGNMRKKLEKRSKKRAKQFTWSKAADQYIKQYQQVIQ